jgi:hypothetical protein
MAGSWSIRYPVAVSVPLRSSHLLVWVKEQQNEVTPGRKPLTHINELQDSSSTQGTPVNL